MTTAIETTYTATHIFWIKPGWRRPETFEALFRPLNPKTSEPWQASHSILHGADVQVEGYRVPTAYSTIEKARAAVDWKKANFKR